MPALPERIRVAALRGQQELADENTPFVRNAWYVAALSDEVGRPPLARRILDVPVMLYRKLDGQPVALEDRCAHRSFPLSRGTLDGDSVVCGYHGARYDCTGRCEQVPSQAVVPPGALVRNFVLHEAGHGLYEQGLPAPQPHPVEQLRAGELGADPGTGQPVDRLTIEVLGLDPAGEQRGAPGFDAERPAGATRGRSPAGGSAAAGWPDPGS